MSEIELILTKLKIVSEEKENGIYLCDKKHSKILLDYIQQKENIIKEVRHYIKDTKQDGYKLVWIDKDNNYFESGIEEILEKEK